MKLSGLALAAATIAASFTVVAPASAQQRHVEVHRTVTRTVVHSGPRVRHHRRHRVCNVRWVNHHRVRRCWWR